jgi:hypothetical protein
MAGNAQGALKTAAVRIGVSVEEYTARVAAGEKWCRGCRAWHQVDAFNRDSARGDGRKATCRTFDHRKYEQTYAKVPAAQRRPKGPAPAQAREGDVRQARRRVNVLVRTGRLPRPNSLPCVDCGHRWGPGERRHEYDHYLGYAAAHHLDVEVVCTTCHHEREQARAAQ